MKLRSRIVKAGTLAALLLLISGHAQSQRVAVRAGTLIDPETGSSAEDQIILISDGRIESIGAETQIPRGVEVIDLSDSFVMPGLFDVHTHLCMTVRSARDNGNYYYTTLNDPDVARAIDGVVNAGDVLRAGFTSVRDLGAEGRYACTYVRYAISRGEIAGPSIQNAGRILAPFGAQFRLQPDRPKLAEPEYFIADTRDEMLKAIRENAHFGARVIKIVVDDQPYVYSTDDIRFIRDEAERAGLKVAAHAFTPIGVRNAAEAGVASIEHLTLANPDDFELLKDRGIVAVFTPLPPEYFKDVMSVSEANRVYESAVTRLAQAYETGVQLAFGSDVLENKLGTRGETAIRVIDGYVDAGVPPAEILKAMTSTAAKLMGVETFRGAIRPGLAADIIATSADPLENIHALADVSFVMKDGLTIVSR
jgi:imidazolonepropionase-like amidohydrolase